MNISKTALVFGATGLVGKALIRLLLSDDRYSRINVANRREIEYLDEKIKEFVIDYDQLEEHSALFKATDVFICLGTTIKKAGSQKAFQKVDLELPKRIASMAEKSSVQSLILISSLGAESNSSNFYLKTKGQAEEVIFKKQLNSFAVRPSMLLGDRQEKRLGETIGKFFIKIFDPLLIGRLKKYRGIYDIEVAKAMISIVNSEQSKKVFQSDELKTIASKYDSNKK